MVVNISSIEGLVKHLFTNLEATLKSTKLITTISYETPFSITFKLGKGKAERCHEFKTGLETYLEKKGYPVMINYGIGERKNEFTAEILLLQQNNSDMEVSDLNNPENQRLYSDVIGDITTFASNYALIPR